VIAPGSVAGAETPWEVITNPAHDCRVKLEGQRLRSGKVVAIPSGLDRIAEDDEEETPHLGGHQRDRSIAVQVWTMLGEDLPELIGISLRASLFSHPSLHTR
jgi:hypothetical protein